ncbi:hypothetical protein LWI28_004186 [Acer negundo]|uniref:Uncharacterized protein n=1 Tax=Acer negundo TaxID=4023 RepID=A0AAD5IKK8_ACENE|nr:hypothetical protein LWI28_004186 [Acer negundo]
MNFGLTAKINELVEENEASSRKLDNLAGEVEELRYDWVMKMSLMRKEIEQRDETLKILKNNVKEEDEEEDEKKKEEDEDEERR